MRILFWLAICFAVWCATFTVINGLAGQVALTAICGVCALVNCGTALMLRHTMKQDAAWERAS